MLKTDGKERRTAGDWGRRTVQTGEMSPTSTYFLLDEAGAGEKSSQALRPGDKKPGPASPWLLPWLLVSPVSTCPMARLLLRKVGCPGHCSSSSPAGDGCHVPHHLPQGMGSKEEEEVWTEKQGEEKINPTPCGGPRPAPRSCLPSSQEFSELAVNRGRYLKIRLYKLTVA